MEMAQSFPYPVKYSTEQRPSFEFCAVEPMGLGVCPEHHRSEVGIDTVHDGHLIPQRLLDSPRVRPLIEDGSLWKAFVTERDWGANLVAAHLVRFLGLDGYHRVMPARLVMDFNRFPGNSPPDATPLDRMAIIEPFASCLNHEEKAYVLNSYYDAVSEGMEAAILGKLIKLSIHTYDARNASRTERPKVSIITRSISYQLNSHLPFGLFDPMFPDVLVESCCNTILRDRISITLEKAGISVEHNYPYCAPDGSLEVRSQPWFFFQKVRALFEERYPETIEQSSYKRVWRMLFNTNLRDGDAEALRGFMHRFRKPLAGHEVEYKEARDAYETIASFTRSNPTLVKDYRRAPDRTNTLSVEVRKDLVFRFDGDEPVEPMEDNAREVAAILAEGIATYLSDDLEEVMQRKSITGYQIPR